MTTVLAGSPPALTFHLVEDTAPILPEQVDPGLMPRMCPGLARARLALYAAVQCLPIVQQPTLFDLDHMRQERQTAVYQTALAAYKAHLSQCPACQRMLQDHPDAPTPPSGREPAERALRNPERRIP